jgi:hypothetical protein
MAINWPSISLGSGTGTTYTSPDRYVWVWNGNSWTGSLGNALGGFPNPWVIFDSTGAPTTYPTLQVAYDAALTGETIHLYGSGIEEVAAEIALKDNVNINLNGHAYRIAGGYTYCFTNTSGAINVKFYNGEIRFLPASSGNYYIFYNTVPESSFVFENVKFSTSDGYCGYFRCNVTGGSFYAFNSPAFIHKPRSITVDPDMPAKTIVRDVYGESTNTSGISIESNTWVTAASYINLIGVSSSGESAFYVLSTTGYSYLYNCTAIAEGDGAVGFSFNGGTDSATQGKRIKAEKCYGVGTGNSSGGFSSNGTTLIDCVGEGLTFAFGNGGFCDYIGCSDSLIDDGGQKNSLLITSLAYDSVIDNCAFSNPIVSSDETSADSLIVIRNSTIAGNSSPINFSGSTPYVKFNIENCVIGSTLISTNPITIGGAAGSRIINCTLMSTSPSTTAIVVPAYSSLSDFYLSGNTFIGCVASSHPQLISTTSTDKGNLFY